MLDGIILKTEQYVVSVSTNWTAFLIALAVIVVFSTGISASVFFTNSSVQTETLGNKFFWTGLVAFFSTLLIGLMALFICSSANDVAHTEYGTQYYISVNDYKTEMFEDYYIYKQDGNILILRENGK